MFRLYRIFPMLAVLFILFSSSVQAGIIASSDFSIDDEGWTVFNSANLTHVPTGGNPGGFLRATDGPGNSVFRFQAPSKFLGDLTAAYNFTLTYDLRSDPGTQDFGGPELSIEGGTTGFQSLRFDFDPSLLPPDDADWTSYSILLNESAPGWFAPNLGRAPTQAEFLDLLSDVDRLLIRGEFVSGPDSGDLDNVVLNGATMAAVPEPSSVYLFGLGALVVFVSALTRRRVIAHT